MKLDERHQRRLEATVQLLEDSISRCRRWLGGGTEGIVRVVQASITETERQRLLEQLDGFHSALGEFAGRFELRPRPVELAQVLNAEFSTAWVMLENCRPKRMKGYGVRFDPDASEALNRCVDGLLERVGKLRNEVADREGN